MKKRVSQDSCCNGPVRMDGENRIARCADCSLKTTCGIAKVWRWFYGPLPDECPLPKAAREEDNETKGGEA